MRKSDVVALYLQARAEVVERGYSDEIEWQQARNLASVCESTFLRELAWVVINSGFREDVARRVFPYISLCFFDWSSASEISRNAEICRRTAIPAFGNARKIDAIISAASRVDLLGFESVRQGIAADPVVYLQTFPMIGPVTGYHLAKNLGADVAKPDRHLERIAQKLRWKCVNEMCEFVARETGDRVGVIDLVLWRFSTLRAGGRNAA